MKKRRSELAILTAKCDRCGKKIKGSEIYSDHDGADHCEECHYKVKLEDLIEEYEEKKRWLEKTHLKQLAEMEKKIAELQAKVDLFKGW